MTLFNQTRGQNLFQNESPPGFVPAPCESKASDPATMLFFNGDDGARGTEEFRTLRSRLYHARERMSLKKVLVTSALPKEGKSFTTANLGQVIVRQHGRRALLIDADLRNPQLHNHLGAEIGPGLGDYLREEADEYSIVQRGPMENLFLIPAGRIASNPAELLSKSPSVAKGTSPRSASD